MNTVHLIDCMAFMADIPDKYYELAIVDPEFGIGISKSPRLVMDKGYIAKEWDSNPIDNNYFTELFRISQNQIIWGGNYYALPANKHCLIWDKIQPESLSFGMFDYAWTSFDGLNKIFRYSVKNELNRIHPTQKPVALYKWLLTNYAKPNDKIFDSHVGSGSSRIACYDLGFDFEGCELDADYWTAQENRYKSHISQGNLFDTAEIQTLVYKELI